MKNLKKVLALVLAVVMIMGVVTVASAKTYKDVDSTNTYADAIDALSSLKILDGFEDETFKADGTLNRAQAAKIVAIVHNAATNGKIKDQDAISNLYSNAQNPFVDCNSSWALPFINYCRITGLADGMTATTYAPKRELTGVQWLKLMLTTLNFDTNKEGYTGTGWDFNVLNRANEVGLTAGLAKDWKAIAPITRGEAAQVLYNALTKYLVEYGQKVKNTYVEANPEKKTTAHYAYSFISNEQVAQSGYTLAAKMGIKIVRMYDVFGRPGYKWSYGSWSRFYMDAPVASFTGAVNGCDILVATGVAKTSTTSVSYSYYEDGTKGTSKTFSHVGKNCVNDNTILGGTGALTQIFAADDGKTYIITRIDTYLSKVTKVNNTSKHGNNGGSTELTIYRGNVRFDNGSVDRTVAEMYDYAKNTYVLVQRSWMDVRENADKALVDADGRLIYTGDTIVEISATNSVSKTVYKADADASENFIVDVKAADSKNQKLTGRAMNGKTYHADDVTQLTVDGVKTPAAVKYHLDEAGVELKATEGKTMTFFYDQYENLIGDVTPKAENSYAVVDGIVWVTNGATYSDKQFASAGIVKAGEEAVTDVTVAKVGGETAKGSEQHNGFVSTATVATVKEKNPDYVTEANKHGVVKYSVNSDGEYALTYNAASIVNLCGNVTTLDATSPRLYGAYVADENTIFLVKTKVAGKVVYTSYTGIKNVPTIKNLEHVVAVKETGESFVSFVFVDATNAIFAGSTTVAFVYGQNVNYQEKDTYYTYYNLFINGEKTEINVPKTLVNGSTADPADLFAAGIGLYELSYNADATQVIAVKKLTGADKLVEGKIERVSGGVVWATDTSKSFNAEAAKVYFVVYDTINARIDHIEVKTVEDMADFEGNDFLYTYTDNDWYADVAYVWVELD